MVLIIQKLPGTRPSLGRIIVKMRHQSSDFPRKKDKVTGITSAQTRQVAVVLLGRIVKIAKNNFSETIVIRKIIHS